MPAQENPSDLAKVEEANAKLTQSLQRCESLLSDCRSKLVANSNNAGETEPREQKLPG